MSLSPKDLFEAGDLSAAVEAMNAEVKAAPADVNKRGFLAELLSFSGGMERADVLLDVMGKQDPTTALGISLFRQQLRGAMDRRECFSQGRVPELLADPSDHLRMMLEALTAHRAGDDAEAARLVEEAEGVRIPLKGFHNDTPFNDLRDVDDMTAGFFEVITSTGKYYWIPAEQVEMIEFRKPEHARDLLWRRALMTVTDGPDGEVFLPATYPWEDVDLEDRHRLGRATEWVGGDGAPVRGRGQRTFLIGDEAVPMMEIGSLDFSRNR